MLKFAIIEKKLIKEINHLFKNYSELILEEYIRGQEIQAAVINGDPLGAIELMSKGSFMITKLNILKKPGQNI